MGFTPRAAAERRGVSPMVLELFAHLESAASGRDSPGQVATRHGASMFAADGGTRLSFANEQLQMSKRKQAWGFWQELSCELGVKNSLLFLLTLLAFSFFVAYILTGMHQGIQVGIPVENIL